MFIIVSQQYTNAPIHARVHLPGGSFGAIMLRQKSEIVMGTPKKRPAPPAKKAAGAGSEPGKLRYMQTRLSEAGWKALKLLAVEKGRPLQQLVLEALNDFLKKNGKDPVVTGPKIDAK